MSSVDGSRSVLGASDELHDCGPCKSQSRQRPAEYHCQQCSEYLCARCKEQHKSFKVSRDHNVVKILSLDQLSLSPGKDTSGRQLCSPCAADGHDQTANHYCENCSEYFCNSCLKEHKRFRMSKDHTIWSISTSVRSHEVSAQPTIPSAQLANLSIGTPHTASIKHHGNFLNLKIKSSSSVNIKLPKDKEIPRISSCEFLPNGELLLVDHINCSLKLLDKSLKVKDSIYLPNKPWDAATLDDETVIVTCPRRKKILYIQVYPSFTLGTSVIFDKECHGVSVTSGNIYITCHDNDKNQDNFTAGDIRVLDTRGNELKRIGGERDGKIRFIRPYYIAVAGNVIYVSDWTGKITALTDEDKISFEYCPDDMSDIKSLCVDTENNILVCAASTHNVQVITAAGRKHKNLLISSDNIRKPEGMAYRPSDGTLVVGCIRQENICVFKLG